MAPTVTPTQTAAMDDTMAFDAGHAARAYAAANLHHLEDACGIVESRESLLIRRISTRHGLLASGPLTEKARRDLESANELDAQELALIEAERAADKEAVSLARWAYWTALAILGGAGLWHFIAINWPKGA